MPEPGRQIVKEQQAVGGEAVPWRNSRMFAELCISRAMYFYNSARPGEKPVLFDRSMLDNAPGLERLGIPLPAWLATTLEKYRYGRTVFFTPPWPELFANDAERRHSFQEAEAEYESLLGAYGARGTRRS